MPKGQMKTVSKDELVAQTKTQANDVRQSGLALTSLATLLERAPDFSVALLSEVRASREKAQTIVDELKALENIMALRGRTFAHEQFSSTMTAIKK